MVLGDHPDALLLPIEWLCPAKLGMMVMTVDGIECIPEFNFRNALLGFGVGPCK